MFFYFGKKSKEEIQYCLSDFPTESSPVVCLSAFLHKAHNILSFCFEKFIHVVKTHWRKQAFIQLELLSQTMISIRYNSVSSRIKEHNFPI